MCGLRISVAACPTEYPANVAVDADGTEFRGDQIEGRFGANRFEEGSSDAEIREQLRGAWGDFADRHWHFARESLSRLGLMDGTIKHYSVAHHLAHAASAFRLSGLEDSCIVTVDGKGDGLSATVYRGRPDGKMTLLRKTTARHSLGSFYQAATEALGFVPVDSEYKTMGLAALGNCDGRPNPFDSIISVSRGKFRSSVPWSFRRYNDVNPGREVPNPLGSVSQSDDFKTLLDEYVREDFAFCVQEHCEVNLVEFLREAMQLTGCSDLACAGGVLLNVKANARIQEQLQPSSFFVYPDSADSGLAAGAALEALHREGDFRVSSEFGNPCLGHGYTDREIDEEVDRHARMHGLEVERAAPERIAAYLERGDVIGTFQGRMEMGPRALGHRSVLADPRSAAVKDRINLLLKGREPFVPFAPILLEEDAPKYWKGRTDYRYMTFAVEASDYAKQRVPAVVHIDGTMRPQVVCREWSPWVASVLDGFKALTGEGLLVNTSFNRHGHPIVGSPADALDHLVNRWVEGLAIGRWYVRPNAERARPAS